MESYSPSIQKICVFQKPQSEISNSGISYLNNFLVDLTNSILIESIHNASQTYHKSIQIDDVENSILKIFPQDIAYHIISQSKSRIQLKIDTIGNNNSSNNNSSNNNNNNNNSKNSNISVNSSTSSISNEEDEDGFEIIPREDKNIDSNNNSNNTSNNNNSNENPLSGSLFSPSSSIVSSSFPIELVFQVTVDLIKRKKLIHKDTTFYQIIEQQPSTSNTYIFISYSMETITTRILQRIHTNLINEDEIRKAIQDDHVLNQIRHSILQIISIANKILNGENINEFNGNTSTISINNNLSSSLSMILNDEDDLNIKNKLENDKTIDNNDNKNNNDNIVDNNKNSNNNNKEPEELVFESLSPSQELETSNNISVPNNNTKDKENIDTSLLENNLVEKISSQIITKHKPTRKPTKKPTVTNNRRIAKPVPCLFTITEPVDFVDILVNGIHFEVKNGLFLVFLILVGLIIQSYSEVY